MQLQSKIYLSKRFLNVINCKQPLKSNKVYGRRHLKLFTNCHVLWDILYGVLRYVYRVYHEILSSHETFY